LGGLGSYGSSYGSGYGSSYGGFGGGGGGGYGSSYGGYGGGGYNSLSSPYSSYSDPYGGSYGSPYGGGFGEFNKPPHGRGFIANGFTWIQDLQALVDAFGRFSHLLHANYAAVHGSFVSFVGLYERFGELKRVIGMGLQTFALVQLIQRMLGMKVSAPQQQNLLPGPNMVDEFSQAPDATPRKAKSWFVVLLIVGLSVLGPVLLSRLLRLARRPQLEEVWDKDKGQPAAQTEPSQVRALYGYEPERENELGFPPGELITIRSKPFPEWWEGETTDGRTGLFPANYVEPISESQPDMALQPASQPDSRTPEPID